MKYKSGLNESIKTKRDNFKKRFETKCFQLITEAYDFAIQERVIEIDWHEDDITSELNGHIEKNRQRLKWGIISNVYHTVPKDKLKKEKGYSSKLPIIDLRLTTIDSSMEYRYYMEAKRLKEKCSKLKRLYINEGIDRFLSRKYPKGCLLGYIIEGDIDKTVHGINKLLKTDDKEYEILEYKTHKICHSYYESVHNCGFIIKHLMFDFTSLH